MNEKTKLYNPSVIFVKPRTNKESRDIIQRLHDIGKTEFYNYCHINKAIAPFYSVILLADIVPLNKLFGKDYVFCIDKRKEHVVIIPAFVIPPSFKIKTYKEFMEMDTFELLGSFKEMDSINREAGKLIESGIDLPINCCERFDLINRDAIKLIKISNHFRESKNQTEDQDILAAEILMKIYKEESKDERI